MLNSLHKLFSAASCPRTRGFAWALLLLGLGAQPLQGEISKEYQIKAAFLYNFTKFVEWPQGSFADKSSPIVIGVVGRNPFGDTLETIVRDRTVNHRAIVVKLIDQADEVHGIHLLFVPEGEETHLPPAVWQRVAIIAVGESADFAALGGTIIFTLEGDKVRFEINQETSERAGLSISAQLLKLATVVRRKD